MTGPQQIDDDGIKSKYKFVDFQTTDVSVEVMAPSTFAGVTRN